MTLDEANLAFGQLTRSKSHRRLDPVARGSLPDVQSQDPRQCREQGIVHLLAAEKSADEVCCLTSAPMADLHEPPVRRGLDEVVRIDRS